MSSSNTRGELNSTLGRIEGLSIYSRSLKITQAVSKAEDELFPQTTLAVSKVEQPKYTSYTNYYDNSRATAANSSTESATYYLDTQAQQLEPRATETPQPELQNNPAFIRSAIEAIHQETEPAPIEETA